MAQVILSAIGRDRPGLVGDFTKFMLDRALSIADARMLNLKGQFAMIMLVTGEDPAIARVREELPAHAHALGLAVGWAPETGAFRPVLGLPFRLRVYSLDQPGIVHRVSALLQRHGVNIEELESHVESAPFMGAPLFTVEMHVTVPGSVALRTLRHELDQACTELNCDVDLEPA
jgi:glycine cleavage system transcriptional repressor